MDEFSFVSNSEIGAIEALYQQYKRMSSVDPGYLNFSGI